MGMMMGGKKIIEINPTHSMIMKLQEGIKNTSMNEHIMKDVIQLMYDTAMVASGYSHEDPSNFSSRIYKMIGLGINADVEEEEVHDDVPEPITQDEASEETSKMEELD